MTAPELHAAEVAVGFGVALALGLTGMGGGTFTTPALVLLSGLPATAAVGTSLAFTAIVRVFAWPYHFLGQRVHRPILLALLAGSLPALVLGTLALSWWSGGGGGRGLLPAIGALLVVTSALTLWRPRQDRWQGWKPQRRWLALLAVPIGVETGLSSAGSGAIGGLLLLNLEGVTPQMAVATNLVFGMVLTLVGAALHLSGGSIRVATLVRLLAGGVPGMLLGCAGADRVPAQRLRPLVAVVAMGTGMILLLSAMRW